MQLHEVAEEVQFPFLSVFALVEGVYVVLPVVIEELVVARYVVIYVICLLYTSPSPRDT